MRLFVLILASVLSCRVYAQSPALTPEQPDRFTSFETLATAIFYLQTMYVDEDKIQPKQVVNNALKGIVGSLDPHTMFLPPETFQQITMDTQGEYGGIGIIVQQERGRLVIVSPLENTPAMKAGIKAGDVIMAIDDKQISKMQPNDASTLMRGKPGSKIKLSIQRKDVKELLHFTMMRELIEIHSVTGEYLGQGVFYVRISNFQQNTFTELDNFLSSKKNLKGLILDLRDNPGGLLDQAIKVSNIFLPSGLIVSTVGRDPDKIQREFADQKGSLRGFPMITLINGGSASASEIVAGALQDHQRSVIMGTQSFGKGSVQTLISLPDGSGLKLTVARYYTPKDRSIQAKGITPDISLPPPSEDNQKTAVAKTQKESNLSGHIQSKEIQGSNLPEEVDIAKLIKEWPKGLHQDEQLKTAFKYLRSWLAFQPHSKPNLTEPPVPKAPT